MDKMIYDGVEYELSTYTMKIARLIEKAEKSITMTDAYKTQLSVIKAALGDKLVEKIIGTLNVEEMDLVTLVLVYNEVINGYETRIKEMKQEKEAEEVNTPAVNAIKEMAENVKIITDTSVLKKTNA